MPKCLTPYVKKKQKSLRESHTRSRLPPYLLPLQLQNCQYFLSPLKWPLRPPIPPWQNHRVIFQSSPPLIPQHHLILLAALSPSVPSGIRSFHGITETHLVLIQPLWWLLLSVLCRLILFYTTTEWWGSLRLKHGLSPFTLCFLLSLIHAHDFIYQQASLTRPPLELAGMGTWWWGKGPSLSIVEN